MAITEAQRDRALEIHNLWKTRMETAETDILCKGDWPEEVRMAILQFMENYKTAYSLKRLKYIESIFADDAIIIATSAPSPITP